MSGQVRVASARRRHRNSLQPASALIADYAAKFGITKWAAEILLTANHRRSVYDADKENA